MDPATIGLLISIAPTVLDLLFGSGRHLNTSLLEKTPMYGYGYGMEGYGLEGLGYRRPRRERTVQTFYKDPKVREKYFKHAVFNKAIVTKNPWVDFLRKRGVYKQISDLLRSAREDYRKEHPFPVKDKAKVEALQKHIACLQTELEVLQDKALADQMSPVFLEKYSKKGLTQDDLLKALKDKQAKLQAEIDRLRGYLPPPEV
jgi:hypothetical protein